MQFNYEINYRYEACVLLVRYLHHRADNNKMITYLSRFNVMKDDVKELYRNYEAMVESIYLSMDKANIKSKINDNISCFLEPVFKGTSLAELFYKYLGLVGNYDNNSFFSFALNKYSGNDSNSIVIKDYKDLLKQMESLEFSDNEKLRAIYFYSALGEVIKEANVIIEEIITYIKRDFHFIENDFKRIIRIVNEKYLNDIFDRWKLSKSNVMVFFTIFEYVIWSYDRIDKNYFCINFMHDRIREINYDKQKKEEKVCDAFKALGDKNRYKLIKILSIRKRMYVQEMAQYLELTPATVLHHIEVLKKVDLIMTCIESVDNKRIYYQLNNATLDLLGVNIMDIIGGNHK